MPWSISALKVQTNLLNVSGFAYVDSSLFLQTPLLVDDVATILLNLCLGGASVTNLSSNFWNLSGWTYSNVNDLSSNVYNLSGYVYPTISNLSSFVYTLSQTVDALNPAAAANAFAYHPAQNQYSIQSLQVGLCDSVLLTTSPSDMSLNVLSSASNLVLVGYRAGYENLSATSMSDLIAIGSNAGTYLTGGVGPAVFIGKGAGASTSNANQIVGIGAGAASSNTANFYVTAIGTNAAKNNSGDYVVAVGLQAAQSNAGSFVVATGYAAAQGNTGTNVVASGSSAATNNAGSEVVALGSNAAVANTATNVIAIGSNVAVNNTGSNLIALGPATAFTNTGANVVALGATAAQGNSGNSVVGLGSNAVYYNTGNTVVALGEQAGESNAGSNVAFMSVGAGLRNTGSNVVGIGNGAASSNSGNQVVALGNSTAGNNAGSDVVALGRSAGQSNLGTNVIALGATAGFQNTMSDALIVYSDATNTRTSALMIGDLSENRLGINIPKTTKPSYSLDVCGDIRVSIPPFTFFTVSGTTSANDLKVDISAQYNANPISNVDAGVWMVGHYCKLSGDLTQAAVPVTNAFTYVSDNIWWVHGEVTGTVTDICASTWYFNLMRVGSNFSTYSTTNFSNFSV